MTRFPGLGLRLSDRLQFLGFWKDGRPDVGRFCREKSYRPQYVYAWLKDRMPAYDNIQRLCSDLDVPATWFVFGDAGTRAHRPRRAARGTAIAVVSPTALDLGPLIEATKKVASLQADLEALLAAFPDACWWLDEQGKVLNVSGTVTPADRVTIGRSIREVLPSDAATALSRGIATALRSGDVATVELVLPISGGTRTRTYEARIRPVTDRSARARKVLAVVRDVSERHVREREYHDLIEGSTNGMCVHDEFVIQYANRAMARILGYGSPADLMGRDVRELVPDHRRALTPRGDFPRRQTTDVVMRDGTRVRVEVLARRTTWHSLNATLLILVSPLGPAR